MVNILLLCFPLSCRGSGFVVVRVFSLVFAFLGFVVRIPCILGICGLLRHHYSALGIVRWSVGLLFLGLAASNGSTHLKVDILFSGV